MKRFYLIFLAVLFFSCQNEDFNKLEELSSQYFSEGRSDSVKNEIIYLFEKCDTLYGDDLDYLELKAYIFVILGDFNERRKIIDRIPNNDLHYGADIFNRLSDSIYAGKNEGVVELTSKLCENHEGLYDLFIHDVFPMIIVSEDFDSLKTNNYKYLKEIRETNNKKIIESTSGLNIWVNALRAKDCDELLNVARSTDWGGHIRNPRYKYLVANLLIDRNCFAKQADSLISSALENSNNKLKNIPHEPTDRIEFEKRALLRYYIAYGSYLKNEILLNSNKTKELSSNVIQLCKENLRTASIYSPDQKDIKVKHAYMNDVHILKGKEEYRTEYLKFLKEQNLFEESLDEAIKTIINEPDKIEIAIQIIDHVEKNFSEISNNRSFKDHLEMKFQKILPKAVDFSFETIEGKPIALSMFHDKWVLLDFWGTWCAPCRDELPKLNSFYLENGKNKNSEIVLITIASRDFEENVIAFIQNNNYKFPVIMSDNKIEKNYSVIGFPTKVLISPNGYYFNIPYQSDFQKIANDYMNLKKYL